MFLSVPTRNIDAVVEFYGTLLGLPCSAWYGRVPGAECEQATSCSTTVTRRACLKSDRYTAMGARPGMSLVESALLLIDR